MKIQNKSWDRENCYFSYENHDLKITDMPGAVGPASLRELLPNVFGRSGRRDGQGDGRGRFAVA